MNALVKIMLGIAISAFVFIVFAWGFAENASRVNADLLKQKVAEDFRQNGIKRFSEWDIKNRLNDSLGIETFTDCITLQAAIVNNGISLKEKFNALVGQINFGESRQHPCDTLSEIVGVGNGETVNLLNYNRYWWGSAILARTALGFTSLSLDEYRKIVHVLSFISLGIFVLTFFYAYGRSSLVYAPLFLSILLGFGMLTMERSIAHTPEFIIALLILSFYALYKVQFLNWFGRAFSYTLLGSICIYFDLFSGNFVLVVILLCCQISAPHVTRAIEGREDRKDLTLFGPGSLMRDIVENMSFVVMGCCIALFIRILGYSLFSGMSFPDGFHQWIENLSTRISGDIPTYRGNNIDPALYAQLASVRPLLLAAKLVFHRYEPFQGFLSGYIVDAYYLLGFACWAISVPLCWRLHKKGILHIGTTTGFFMAASLVPVWYVLFMQHSIVHAWITGRLISLFCGLGMSLAVFLGLMILKAPHRHASLKLGTK